MCDCISQVNEFLSKEGERLHTPLIFNNKMTKETDRVSVMTERVKGKGRAKHLFASFCPFCGEHYSAAKDKANS